MEKYGFVYIWYDKKKGKRSKIGRFYIGCHWGTENDGYICSSSVMKKAYKRRPQDFEKRRILDRTNDRKELLELEYKWLKLIKKEELGKKYYNLRRALFVCNKSSLNIDVKKKISESLKKAYSEGRKKPSMALLGKKHSEETKQKMSIARKKQIRYPASEESKEKMSVSHTGKIHTEERKRKISESIKNWWEKRKEENYVSRSYT